MQGRWQWLLITEIDATISNMGNLQQVVQACTDSYWPGWNALAVLFSGFIGATVATVAIYMSRRTAREKNAADILQMAQRDEKLAEGIRLIQQAHKDGIMESLAFEDKRMSDDARSVRYVLNFYENVAVGIKRKIYSEAFIKDSSYTTITDLCDRTRPFVVHIRVRNKQETAWKKLELLGQRWKGKPILVGN